MVYYNPNTNIDWSIMSTQVVDKMDLADLVRNGEARLDELDANIQKARAEYDEFGEQHVGELNEVFRGNTFYVTATVRCGSRNEEWHHHPAQDLKAERVEDHDTNKWFVRITCRKVGSQFGSYSFIVTNFTIIES
jgi:hypothetical protein